MNDSPPKAEEFASFSSPELLQLMADRDRDPALARGAWQAFYARHVLWTFGVCARLARGWSQAWAEDLAADVMLRALERAETFVDPSPDDEPRSAKAVKAWLGAIANNLAKDKLGARRRIQLVLDQEAHEPELPGPSTSWSSEIAPSDEPEDGPDLTRMKNAFELLTDKERMVLQATTDHYGPDGKPRRISHETMSQLESMLNTTSANVRQIRKRALDKLREAMAQGTGSSTRRGGR